MTAPDRDHAPGDTVDGRGITLTAEGRRQARRELTEADAHWTPQRRAEARETFLARLDAA